MTSVRFVSIILVAVTGAAQGVVEQQTITRSFPADGQIYFPRSEDILNHEDAFIGVRAECYTGNVRERRQHLALSNIPDLGATISVIHHKGCCLRFTGI